MIIPTIRSKNDLLKTGAVFDPKPIRERRQQQQTKEIMGLCRTLDYQIKHVFTQNLNAPNPSYYLGVGKVEEIAEFIQKKEEVEPLEFVVVDCPLKASQIFNLENKFHIRVLDRNALILMIFLHHARTNEAKLQIEYAILNHQIPYVTELVRRSKLGEHPGYLAGGEYKVDEYFRLTKRRIRKIRTNLKKIKTSREQRRAQRRRSGFELVTLAGYTNAGKSALLTALTNATVLVEDKLFSTVSTKTRRYREAKILFTDTVGFIKNLPTQLVEAFKSTLEEIIYADHILLVVDISEDQDIILDKLKTSFSIIDQLVIENYDLRKRKDTNPTKIFKPKYYLIFNKSDLEQHAEQKIQFAVESLESEFGGHSIEKYYLLSAKTKDGLNNLINDFVQNLHKF